MLLIVLRNMISMRLKKLNRDDWGKNIFPQIGDKVTYLGDYYFNDSYGNGPFGNRGEGQGKPVVIEALAPNNPYPVAVKSNDSAYGWLKKYQIAKLDTGGYTGSWDTKGGKIGILHQKELVLNANDTENFLRAIQTMRDISNFEVVQKHISGLTEHMHEQNDILKMYDRYLAGAKETTAALTQNIHVNADFPNVYSAYEIQQAFNNLTNTMTQYANSIKR